MQWYYALNGQRLGPISQEEFVKLVTDGVVRSDTLVWTQGMAEWKPYSTVAASGPAPASFGAPATSGAAVDDGTEVCAVSGKRYPRSQMINYGGKWISAEYRDEFFQRQREGVAQQFVGESAVPGPFGYGGFWRRFCAVFLDGLITGVIGMVVGAIVGFIFGASGSLRNTNGAILMQVIIQLISMGIGISYYVYFIRKSDATPGKMAMGLKVLRSDGSKLSVGRIIGRYFAHILNAFTIGIGYLIAAFDDQKRGLHDHVCDTRVVKTR